MLPLRGTGLRPNHITTVARGVGVLGALYFAHGGYHQATLGALLLAAA